VDLPERLMMIVSSSSLFVNRLRALTPKASEAPGFEALWKKVNA